jgi:uncharacterized cupredoxin-like copper-binding protein
MLLVMAAVAVIAGCGGHSRAGAGPPLRISERDFAIKAPERVRAGHVTLVVANRGPDTHELIVVRANGQPLPMRGDGTTLDEERLKPVEAGGLEPGEPGTVRYLRVHLKPGRYVLFCNMSGHYLGGMHRTLIVSPR